MLHRVRISPISLNGHTGVICNYYDVEHKISLAILQDDTVVKNPDLRTALIKMVNFTESKTEEVLEWDDAVEAHARFGHQAAWWARHPEVIDMTTPRKDKNFVRARFTYVDLDKQVTMGGRLIEDRVKIMAKLSKAGEEGRKKIATFYGVTSASTLNDNQIWEQLVGVNNTGKLANPKLFYNQEKNLTNMEHFLTIFKSGDEDSIFRINVIKAVELGIVEKKHNIPTDAKAATYYINNEPVAATEDALIIYLKEHEDLYETFVMEKIKNFDEKQKKEADKKLKAEIGAMEEPEIRQRGRELKIQGWHVLNINQLKKLIDEKEKEAAALAEGATT